MSRFISILFISALAFLTACTGYLVPTAESNHNMEDFEAAWKRVNVVYPYLEYKQIDWQSIYHEYKAKVEQTSGDEIYEVLVEMLGELRDGHIYVRTDGGEYIPTYIPRRRIKNKYAFDPVVVSSYFEDELHLTGEGTIGYGIIAGNIGYIYLGTFDDYYIFNDFPSALKYVRNTDALILDIRHNNGGSYRNLVAAVSPFIDSPLEKPEFYVLGELTPLEPFEPDGDFQYLNSTVVLINGVCYSSADIFPEIMKQIPTVTVVGDTTGGGSSGSTLSAPGEFELPSGKRIYIGTTDWRAYDGLPLEWRGCAPDILVPQSKADLENGHDKQLEYAIELLKK